jgi:hypothetical protein
MTEIKLIDGRYEAKVGKGEAALVTQGKSLVQVAAEESYIVADKSCALVVGTQDEIAKLSEQMGFTKQIKQMRAADAAIRLDNE